MKKVIIVGAGKGGQALLRIFKSTKIMEVVAIIDKDPLAPGMQLAKQYGIQTGEHWSDFLSDEIDAIFEATGDDAVFQVLLQNRSKKTVLIPGSVASIIFSLIEEKEELIQRFKKQSYKQDLILNSTHDAMIAIDKDLNITLFNKVAEKLTGLRSEDVLGKNINLYMPSSQLPRIIFTGKPEINKEQVLENGKKVITTRIPMVSELNERIGAFSVFKDITEVKYLAEELTNLKEVQTLLQAIIKSSEEAISVVDEDGKGIMINPAYTRLTGLSEDDVIGKPATADIAEGKSMHMQVLKTKTAVRGARMKVGPSHKDVLVNVAPIVVDEKVKGSVGVIHDVSEIHQLTNELQRARQIIRTLEAKYTFDDIIGKSEEFNVSLKQAQLGAQTPATVLLRGESGTGKELFAHAIHNASNRKYKKFYRVNCAAISESLLESELFGYEEGAFSGAKRGGKRGLFEESDGGSIFLDEIGELSVNTQAKLLRVLQEGEIVRVGGVKPIQIDVRVIAATNVNLEKKIADKEFREDLYYRLNRMPIQIPPLRKRISDIPDLCKHLITKINQDYGRNVERVSDAALLHLQRYHWPGNVRELENVLGRAVIFMPFNENVIDIGHIESFLLNEVGKNENTKEIKFVEGKSLSSLVEKFERNILEEALIKHEGNKTATAKALGLSIRNLYYKLEKYNIEKSDLQ
ncbi:sigma-54-dependent Fis family transcriptional regulator [Lottiidibacillus patelloidae]|uniref:Sigma-54-dependent Fis family transcriptional regulator n=1 Tax=Lottiidibacillus patelloidae TaxID=2670334 RepID=A0A263BV67_9BACI|nr:sigma 54-interacting transcriptional regulator [Lottiidibacillus patelloidae]OZM57609.1 sigma-54-dependent Fis family transcriptional regulator [Lottiidibacillus patelloidae]